MFSLLTPYRTLFYAAIGTALIFGTYYGYSAIEKKGYNRAQSEYVAKALIAEQAARVKEAEFNRKLQEANNAAILRDRKIDTLTREYSNTSNGLRDTISKLRRQLSADTLQTLRNKADTALAILGECQEKYGEMAEAADRHASDVKTLEEAWPE